MSRQSNSTITTYEQAIEVMKDLTKQGKAFSIRFIKENGEISYIDKAQLGRMKSSGSLQYLVPILNVENKERRKAHITRLLAINQTLIILQR
ncbi:hypothetical protein ACH3O9_11360 [Leeuwenhoekiella sp. A16]|uniref:hypothetical protein n=1 Tax=Leeuwenhoekiella sp. A16 TaxID=3141462 RepID=UPI003A80C203